MIDHLGMTVADFDTSKAFYDQAMAPLGASLLYMVPPEYTGGEKVGGYGRDRPVFWLHAGKDKPRDRQHIAFTARSRSYVPPPAVACHSDRISSSVSTRSRGRSAFFGTRLAGFA